MTIPVSPAARLPRPLGNDVFARVTLDGSGNGTAQIGPSRIREHWQIQYVTVSVTFPSGQVTPTNEAQAALYLGSNPQASQLVSQTATGSSGDTCGMGGMDIQSGQKLITKWVGGDSGQVATMVVVGTYTIGSPSGI